MREPWSVIQSKLLGFHTWGIVAAGIVALSLYLVDQLLGWDVPQGYYLILYIGLVVGRILAEVWLFGKAGDKKRMAMKVMTILMALLIVVAIGAYKST